MYLYSSTNLPSIFKSVLLHLFQLRKSFYRSNAIPLVTLRKLFAQPKLVLPVKMTKKLKQVSGTFINQLHCKSLPGVQKYKQNFFALSLTVDNISLKKLGHYQK